MKMKKYYLVLLAVLSFFIGTSPSQASTFNLFFFDRNHKQVGHGQFITDPGQTICVEFDIYADCANPEPGPGFVGKQNPLVSFSATIQGVSWDYEAPGKTWWGADGQSSGSQWVSRSETGVVDNSWFFGDPYFGLRTLSMGISQATASFGSGEWSQSVGFDKYGNPLSEWVFGSGIWVTETPIPAAVYLFGSACLIALRYRRKVVG
jgi:hypothetical protein